LPPLYATAGVLIADDATVVGAADDLLLPLVGLAILVTHVAVMNAPTTAELEAAWATVVSRAKELSHAAEAASSRRKPGCYCRCFKAGVGPYIEGRVANPETCLSRCKNRKFPGFQCGGPVIWIQN
jgi:hypothetical protein